MLIKHLFFNCLLNELFKNICKSKHNQLILEQILAISIFFLLTIIITFPLIANFANESAGDGCYDKCHMMWRWWWAEFSVENGLDPNYTNYIFYPNGTQLTGNLAQFTTAFAYILLQIFDYTVTWNLIWILSFIFGGYGAFLLANHFNKNFYSSLIAGIIFTFSTYHMTHAGFHIGLSMIVWIPIFILFLFKILEKDSKFYAVLGGFCFFLTSITHLYYSVFIIMFSCIFFLFYIFKQKEISNKTFTTNFFIIILIGIVLTLIVFSPTLSSIDEQLKRPLIEHIEYSINLENLVIPTSFHTYLNNPWQFGESNCGSLNTSNAFGFCIDSPRISIENYVFLGYSVIFLASLSIIKFRDMRTLFWLIVIGIFVVLSLGPELKIFNELTGVFLPERILYDNIPGWDNFRSPARFIVMADLGMAILASFAVYSLINQKFFAKKKQYVLIGIIVIVVLFELSTIPYPSYSEPIPEIYEIIKNDETDFAILESPIDGTGDFGFMSDPSFSYYQTYHEKPIYGGHESRPTVNDLLHSTTYFLNMFSIYGEKNDIVKQDLKIYGTSILNYYNIKYVIIHKTPTNLIGNIQSKMYFEKNFVPETKLFMDEILIKPYQVYEDGEILAYKIPKPVSVKPFVLLGSGWLTHNPEDNSRITMPHYEIIIINPLNNIGKITLEVELQGINAIDSDTIIQANKNLQISLNNKPFEYMEIPATMTKIIIDEIELQPGKNIVSFDTEKSVMMNYDIFENVFEIGFKVSSISLL